MIHIKANGYQRWTVTINGVEYNREGSFATCEMWAQRKFQGLPEEAEIEPEKVLVVEEKIPAFPLEPVKTQAPKPKKPKPLSKAKNPRPIVPAVAIPCSVEEYRRRLIESYKQREAQL